MGQEISTLVLSDCQAAIDDHLVIDQLHELHFDIAIATTFISSYCAIIILHKLQIPFVAYFSFLHSRLSVTPALPSFVPLAQSGLRPNTILTAFTELDIVHVVQRILDIIWHDAYNTVG